MSCLVRLGGVSSFGGRMTVDFWDDSEDDLLRSSYTKDRVWHIRNDDVPGVIKSGGFQSGLLLVDDK